VIGDSRQSENCDSSHGGYDSPPLLNLTTDADGSPFHSLLLEEIDLHGNRLTNLPSWLFFRYLFLRRVDVSQNRLESLPFAVWACTSLVELNLSNNCLSSLTCTHVETVPLPLDGDIDQCPGTPASFTSESSLQPDLMTVRSTKDTVHIRHLERWRDKVEVRPVTYLGGGVSARSSQAEARRSHLKELDLSHNEFEEVPPGLPCVAPCLERLNLSHNRLTRFGSVDCYPAALRLLDLSHNRISVMDLTEDSHSAQSTVTTPVAIPTTSSLSSSSRHCCSPFIMNRLVHIKPFSIFSHGSHAFWKVRKFLLENFSQLMFVAIFLPYDRVLENASESGNCVLPIHKFLVSMSIGQNLSC